MCGQDETIEHLLYNCKYARKIWNDFMTITGLTVTLRDIILSVHDDNHNFVLSLIAYLIYKEWLINSLSDKSRENNPSLRLFKGDLIYKREIYRHCNWTGICDLLAMLIDYY